MPEAAAVSAGRAGPVTQDALITHWRYHPFTDRRQNQTRRKPAVAVWGKCHIFAARAALPSA
jgi:hypothetical protein